jgi:uncharacterized SAM-binding protein YcdF (DUF218 family)
MSTRSLLQVRALLMASGVAILAAAALSMTHARLLAAAGRWLDVGERPVAVDYVLPLSGDCNSRPFVAAAMYRAGLAPKIIVPRPGRGDNDGSGADLAHEEIYRQVLLKLGVPQRDIIMLDGENHTTFDEAQRLRHFLAEGGPKSVAIVTNDLHTRRTRWTFEHVLRGTPHQLHFVSAPVADYQADVWWQAREGATAYPCEMAKLAFYWFYYGPGLLWAGSLLAGGVAAALVWFKSRSRRAVPADA